jgi:hypothetical protein
MREHILEPDPSEAVHDGRCPACYSADIQFDKDLGFYSASGMWAGKPYERVRKLRWRCDNCIRLFVSNNFITQ